MRKNNKLPKFSAGGGSVGLIAISSDWIKEYLMNIHPILSNALFIIFLIIFLWGLFEWAFTKFTLEKIGKPQMLLFYILPIIIISFSSGGLLSGLAKKESIITPDNKLEQKTSKIYNRQQVLIDGKHFINCTFRDVELRWEGDNFQFSNSKFTGDKGFSSSQMVNKKVIELIWKVWDLDKYGELIHRDIENVQR